MRLNHFKLLSPFRGLPKNFKIEFSPQDQNTFEPICLVGLNGSGKSNVLEVLAEFFFYLENCFNNLTYSEKHIEYYSTNWGFELSYCLPRSLVITNVQDRTDIWQFIQAAECDITINIIKKIGEFPSIKITSGKSTFSFKDTQYPYVAGFLPSRIVGYSSGMNELLSNTFVKMDFRYVEDFISNIQKSQPLKTEMNRMFFMSYDSNKYITVANFLFDQDGFDSSRFRSSETESSDFGGINLTELKKETDIQRIAEFSVSLTLEKNKDTADEKYSYLPNELETALDKLKACATFCVEDESEVRKNKIRKQVRYDYWVNKETKSAFQDQFASAAELYQSLYYLQLLNNNLVSQATRRKIINAPTGALDNLSDEIPKFEKDKLVFRLHNLKLVKDKGRVIEYRKLSDGEHQLLQVMGSLVLMDDEGTLFLFDEPETHFNPEWRSKFVKLANASISTTRYQQLLLTTHSPFIISDSKPQNVFVFKRGKNGLVKQPVKPEFNTFGASVSKITSELFNKEESLADLALGVIKQIKKMPMETSEDIQAAKEASRVLGESPEKILLFRDLLLRQESIDKDA